MSRETVLKARNAAIAQQRHVGSDITIVTGAPCSGKSTYVKKHAQTGDLIIDFDTIAQAIGSSKSHDHARSIVDAAKAARTALIQHAVNGGITTWLIAVYPKPQELTVATNVIRMHTTRDQCHQRADDDGRSGKWHQLIDDWYRINPT